RRRVRMGRTFWMVPLRLRIISSTLWATSCVCLCRSTRTAGSMGGMSSAGQGRRMTQAETRKLGLELILIFCSRLRHMKWVRSPSWLTVPSSSRAEEMVARRPSGCPPRPPARAAPP
uniref:Secreted protein n=1 Tax=Esox lucius TaxID=8010 RepID=A0A3P8Y5D2_ESOLU